MDREKDANAGENLFTGDCRGWARKRMILAPGSVRGETRETQTSKKATSTDERTLVAAVVSRMGRAVSHASPTVFARLLQQTRNHPRPDENDTMPTPCLHYFDLIR